MFAGRGIETEFEGLEDITVDQHSGTLFVCDYYNNTIKKVSPQGISSLLSFSPPLSSLLTSS